MATITKGGAACPAYTPPCLMTKKDSEKEVERPRYYSQFWLDVAAGRRVIGTPKTDEGAEGLEPEMTEVVGLRKPVRDSMAAVSDGYQEPFAQEEAEPAFAEEEEGFQRSPEPDLEEELAGAVGDLDIPNIEVDEEGSMPIYRASPQAPDTVIAAQEEEEEPSEELFDEEEEEEEEEDWTVGRGRKKAKPSRPTKQPPKRPEKRRRY